MKCIILGNLGKCISLDSQCQREHDCREADVVDHNIIAIIFYHYKGPKSVKSETIPDGEHIYCALIKGLV